MRRLVCLSLVVSLTAGCGATAAPGAGARAGAHAQRAASEVSFARQFYERIRKRYAGEAALDGERVSLRWPDQPTSVYDFTETARTGRVSVTIGAFAHELAFAELMQGEADEVGAEVLPALLVPIALDMAAAGAQALALYWIKHRGEEFDRAEAAKVVALAMALAVVPFLGEMSALRHVLPVAAKLVAACPSFALRDIVLVAAGMSGELVEVVRMLIRLRKQR